jgi:hypothetical protein
VEPRREREITNNAEILLQDGKETGLEGRVDETK